MQLAFDTYWVTPFRTYVMGQLDLAKDQAAGGLLRDSLAQWSALMPDQIIQKIVAQSLMPKLT